MPGYTDNRVTSRVLHYAVELMSPCRRDIHAYQSFFQSTSSNGLASLMNTTRYYAWAPIGSAPVHLASSNARSSTSSSRYILETGFCYRGLSEARLHFRGHHQAAVLSLYAGQARPGDRQCKTLLCGRGKDHISPAIFSRHESYGGAFRRSHGVYEERSTREIPKPFPSDTF